MSRREGREAGLTPEQRQAIKPFLDELAADEEQLVRGPEDWLGWWERTGERGLHCILMTAWDPVGASWALEAWDDYDRYIPGVAHRLRDTADPDEAAARVTEYLNHIERDAMGTWTDDLDESLEPDERKCAEERRSDAGARTRSSARPSSRGRSGRTTTAATRGRDFPDHSGNILPAMENPAV